MHTDVINRSDLEKIEEDKVINFSRSSTKILQSVKIEPVDDNSTIPPELHSLTSEQL